MKNPILIQKRVARDREILELAQSNSNLLLRDIATQIHCGRTVVVAALKAAGIKRKEGRRPQAVPNV